MNLKNLPFYPQLQKYVNENSVNAVQTEIFDPTRPFTSMTAAQRAALGSPQVGTHIYQTDGGADEGVWVRKSTGWVKAY